MTEGMEVLSAGAPGDKTPVLRNRRNVGILLMGVWEFVADLAARARCLICQALFVHRLWITTGVWEFVGFC